eukprot:6415132-Prymnesium_polylepis.1
MSTYVALATAAEPTLCAADTTMSGRYLRSTISSALASRSASLMFVSDAYQPLRPYVDSCVESAVTWPPSKFHATRFEEPSSW